MTVKINVKKLAPDAVVPHYSRQGDAALDLYAHEEVIIPAGERRIVHTKIALEFPYGHAFVYRDRSGLAAKSGITALGGVFDSNYRGEHKVILLNTSKEDYHVHKGDRIVQGILLALPEVEVEEVEELTDSNRGDGHFGSSGR